MIPDNLIPMNHPPSLLINLQGAKTTMLDWLVDHVIATVIQLLSYSKDEKLGNKHYIF